MELYDILLAKRLGGGGGGGGSAVINPLSVTANGTYTATGGVDGYSPVTVNVPKPLGTKNITANGDYDVESYASAHVSVSGITPSGTYSITNNGIYDIVSYASVDVNVSGGGGITADDIALRSISGMISGSASMVSNYAFINCRITDAFFSNAQTLGAYAFMNCDYLSKADFPNLLQCGASAFDTCIRLAEVSVPNLHTISAQAFAGCSSLSTLSLPKASYMGSYQFRYCVRLISLYFMGSSIPTLANSNAFSSTPIGGYTNYTSGVYGSIFVPSSLYSQYIVANNWSNYSARIVSM